MYYNERLELDPSDTVYAFWIGINDLERGLEQGNGTLLWKEVVGCISQQMVSSKAILYRAFIMGLGNTVHLK